MNPIKKIREKLGYNQVEFAELLEIAQSTVSYLENGIGNPSFKTLRKLHYLIKKNNLNQNIEKLLYELYHYEPTVDDYR